MTDYIKVTVDGDSFYLLKQPNDEWLFTHREPPLNGLNPTVVTFTEADGEITVETSDERLAQTIVAFIRTKQTTSGTRMLDYYPYAINTLLEYQALIQTIGFEVDFFKSDINLTLDDAYLTTMGEERISQWEKALQITPKADYSVSDRREVIIARIRSGYKLNSTSINDIVRTFTNGTAKSYVENSCLYVKISPPPNNKQYKFESVERELERRIPAHLGLEVTRNYATWGEVTANHTSWQQIKDSFADWEGLMLYVAPTNKADPLSKRRVYIGSNNN